MDKWANGPDACIEHLCNFKKQKGVYAEWNMKVSAKMVAVEELVDKWTNGEQDRLTECMVEGRWVECSVMSNNRTAGRKRTESYIGERMVYRFVVWQRIRVCLCSLLFPSSAVPHRWLRVTRLAEKPLSVLSQERRPIKLTFILST